MSHPHNRRERFEIGVRKGRHRALFLTSVKDRIERPDLYEALSRKLRDTVCLCSCSMCGNPRRDPWTKDKRTMQERKFAG